MKLLAKTAEERYQSAWGITTDLKKCWQQLETNNTITEFELARDDISDKLQIPQKLYGREREIAILLDAFESGVGSWEKGENLQFTTDANATLLLRGSKLREHNSQSSHAPLSSLVLVRGYAGIGKSSLVQEIFKPVTQKKGYFIQGKFEQYQQHVPYSALIKALQELICQLLIEDSNRLVEWREKILAKCGENIQVIIDVVPELTLLLGQQLAVPPLNPTAAQHRFKLVFYQLIQVFARPEHPLVIFLDDLQWVDSASLQLIQVLVTEGNKYLFLIGAYRDNEVSAFHPLSLSLAELAKLGVKINYISLSTLNFSQINQLLSDTFKCDRTTTEPLASLVLDKTHGNPFFINEFLISLQVEKLLRFEQQGTWQWNLAEIQLAKEFDRNLTELLINKIQKLNNNTQEILKLAACIGSAFELSTLIDCLAKPAKEIAAFLQTAIAVNLIIPIGNDHKAIELDIPGTKTLVVRYKFAHDRIQQAAYSLIPESAKQSWHQKVGCILLQNTPIDKREEKIFDIVNQLNFSSSVLVNQTEKDELAALNLIAAKKAKASIAYESALSYASLGIKLIKKKLAAAVRAVAISIFRSSRSSVSLWQFHPNRRLGKNSAATSKNFIR